MKYSLNEKVRTANMDGKYNNALGTVEEIHTDIDIETVYTVKYDIPFGSCTKGMYKESDLIKTTKQFIITFAATGGVTIEANTEEEAKAKFNAMSDNELLEELTENGIEITDCFVEE